MPEIECTACHESRQQTQMIPAHAVLPNIADKIQASKPDWSPDEPICEVCVNEALAKDAEAMLKQETHGDLTELEREVIESLRHGDMLPQNVAEMEEGANLKPADHFADHVANMVGSFTFAALVLICILIWLSFSMSSGLIEERPVFVFGGLSSVLGVLAAIQNPIILMSQRRAARRDRLRNENDYRVNLKSELEIRYINAKLDLMLERISKLHQEDTS